MHKKKIQIGFLTLLWLVNPVFSGCNDTTKAFSFDERDMLELMYDINETDWTIETEEGFFLVDFSLQQSSGDQASVQPFFDILGSAHACGERSFIAEAEACLDVSMLMLEGTVTITEQEDMSVVIENMPLEGSMEIYGLDLNNAEVYLQHSDGDIYLSSGDGMNFTLNSVEW